MSDTSMPPVSNIKPKLGRDDWIQRGFMLVIALYLVIALALPLYTILSKAFFAYSFDLAKYEVQVSQEDGTYPDPVQTLTTLNNEYEIYTKDQLTSSANGRLSVAKLLPDFNFRSMVMYKFRALDETTSYLVNSELKSGDTWLELDSNIFRRLVLRPSNTIGFDNFVNYFSRPALTQSIKNSLWIATISTLITVSLAFWFAYGLARSCMRFKGIFRMVAALPILVPSLLPGIALIYLFGNQGLLKSFLLGQSIYGPIGIVVGSVFFTFPHAMIIISTALSLSDARLFEASTSLKASRWKTFWTVTIPGARYGLFSAAFVVFNLVITDFGLPKVIGGQYNMLAVDIYKQVIGQQNFEMGAVVSVILLIPALLAFGIDRQVQKKQVAILSAKSVVFEPKHNRLYDRIFLIYAILVSIFIVGIIAVCQLAALVKFWPYDMSLSFAHYNFDTMDGGGWSSYKNSIVLAISTAIIGTIVVFLGAYMVEKTKGFKTGRALFQMLAMLPMAVPGMVLGLAYIFFFNNPDNPFNFIYGTMIILVVSTVTHFYTVSHLTAVTALKQMDIKFESVSSSLKQPFYKLVKDVTIPISMPAILNISIYLFVNAMTTVSAVVFLYSTDTALASIAVLNMDDAGDIAPAAAMGMLIFYANSCARILHAIISRGILKRSEAWRKTG